MPLRRAILGLALALVLITLGLWWRAVWITRQLLREDAPAAIQQKSDNVYQVAVGRVRFNPVTRRVTVDTIHVTTNEAVNAARPRARSALRVSFGECTMSGVHVFKMIFRQGLVAETFGCAAVSARVDVPRSRPDSSPPGPLSVPERGDDDAERSFFVLQQSLQLPASAPQVRVARIDFPHVVLDFRLQQANGEARLQLEHLSWLMTGFLINPGDSTAAARPLFSDTVEIAAREFTGELDSVTAITVKALRLSLSDSTLSVRGVEFAPRASQPWRRTVVRATTTRVDARGLDVGVFLLRQGLRARRVQLDSLRLDIFADHRRPKNPRPPRRRTPQAWVAAIERGIHVDSVVIKDGEIVYREHQPRHARPGVMTWGQLSAIATNVRHVVGRKSTRDRLTLVATSRLQNEGQLDVRFVVPLDAPGFAMTYRGRLGPMAATRFNAFIEETLPFRLDKGRVRSFEFNAQVTNGVARGTVVPRYNDLKVEVTGKGAGGIVGTGGVIGDIAQGVATLVANATEIRSDNPEEGKGAPSTGTINHAFTADQTLPAFLWKSLRGGLFAVVRK